MNEENTRHIIHFIRCGSSDSILLEAYGHYRVLMNVMLTGKVPESKLYDGKFRKIIEKCTQTVPNNRYQNVKQIKRVLKLIKY